MEQYQGKVLNLTVFKLWKLMIAALQRRMNRSIHLDLLWLEDCTRLLDLLADPQSLLHDIRCGRKTLCFRDCFLQPAGVLPVSGVAYHLINEPLKLRNSQSVE